MKDEKLADNPSTPNNSRWHAPLAGAVNIITSTNAGPPRYGTTATAVCSATAEPPTVLVCINKLATTHGAVAKSKAFCVNVLRAEDWELSTTFSGAQSGENRFKSRDWTRLGTGSPVLIDALVSFDCRVVKQMAHGSHTIFSARSSRWRSARRASRCSIPRASTSSSPRSPCSGGRFRKGSDYWGF